MRAGDGLLRERVHLFEARGVGVAAEKQRTLLASVRSRDAVPGGDVLKGIVLALAF